MAVPEKAKPEKDCNCTSKNLTPADKLQRSLFTVSLVVSQELFVMERMMTWGIRDKWVRPASSLRYLRE